MYSATTHGMTVTAKPVYLADQSKPENNHFVWAYQIRIHNERPEAVQILSRSWTITDAYGATQEVRGPGVVGEQPVLKPGESYEYASGTPLRTPSGFMRGRYEIRGEAGDLFWIDIPAFSLDSPHQPMVVN